MKTITNISPRPRKFRGEVFEYKPDNPMHADIEPGKWIRIYGEYQGKPYDRTFNLGDEAEYDSFNLRYTGKIVSIGEKSVTIDDHGQRRRLDLHTFSWRNHDFDAARTAAHNAEEMLYI